MDTKVIWMADQTELIRAIHELIEDGNEVTSVTPLRAFRDPIMSGNEVTNWLIIYKPQPS
jgi:hypothetical protein